MIKKEIYQYFAQNANIYLPVYQLDKIDAEIKERSKNESVLSLLDEMSKRPDLQAFNKKAKGAYVVDRVDYSFLNSIKNEIEMLDIKTGEVVKEFASFYAAAKYLGKYKGHANISAACKGKIYSVYGYKWRFKK